MDEQMTLVIHPLNSSINGTAIVAHRSVILEMRVQPAKSIMVARQKAITTSAYPEGYVQVLIRRRPRAWGTTVVIAGLAFTSAIDPLAVLVFGSAAVAEITRGFWRTGPVVRHAVREATR